MALYPQRGALAEGVPVGSGVGSKQALLLTNRALYPSPHHGSCSSPRCDGVLGAMRPRGRARGKTFCPQTPSSLSSLAPAHVSVREPGCWRPGCVSCLVVGCGDSPSLPTGEPPLALQRCPGSGMSCEPGLKKLERLRTQIAWKGPCGQNRRDWAAGRRRKPSHGLVGWGQQGRRSGQS